MYHNIVIFLLIISNIMNLFMDRYGSGGGRFLIYVVNGLAFIVTFIYLVKKQFTFPRIFSPLKAFFVLFVFYLLIQYVWPNQYFILNNYVRWLLSLLFFFFFYDIKRSKRSDMLMRLYIITFIIECSYKIYLGSSFAYVEDVDKRMGGDTASMGLALVVPLVLYYFRNMRGYALYVINLIFILFSLRRTSILAAMVAIPFIWPSVKKYINKKYLLWGSVIALFFVIRTWRYVGAKVINRFMEYSSSTSDIATYGSGRTEFWRFLYDKYLDNFHWFLGNGLGSVYETYSKYWHSNLSHAHNDLLEILYTFGLVGLALWAIFLYKSYKTVRHSIKYEGQKIFYCALVIYLVVALTSGAILRAEMFPMAMALSILLPKKNSIRSVT